MQTLINNYKIEYLISEGVLATSYHAIDILSNKEFVLKILKPQMTSTLTEDLIRYKKAVAQVTSFKHPYIVSVFEQDEHDGAKYLLIELIKGKSLQDLFKEARSFTVKETVEIACQITSALGYAHSQNLLHLDLRPSNIILESANSNAKLLDFGLSHLIEYTKIKQESDIISVFSYISPEQSGIMKRPSDERSDLYSLGVIFYQLLTAEAPFKASTVGDLLHQHMAKLPSSLKKLNPEVPEVLEQIVLKLLSKEPESRYQTAKGLLADLEEFKKGNTSFVIGRHDRLKKLLFRTRLIGREEEFNKLKEAFEKSKSGTGGVTLVKGEAGRGKSRLVEEIRSYVFERKGAFVSGRCFNQENKTPYQPFRDILSEYIDRVKKLEAQAKENTIKRLQDSLGQLGEIILKINPNMETLLSKQSALVPLDPEREHRRLLMTASKFFLELGIKDEPVVLFLDDLQWSDEASLSLLSEITSQIKNSCLLILGTYRDNEVTETHSFYKIIQEAKAKEYPLEEIALPLFDLKRLNRFLSELLLEDEERLTDLSRYILDKCKGNPFFSLEITRQLVQEKALIYDEEKKHWQIDQEKLNQLTISSNIVDIVVRRIDLLDSEKLNLLSYASVIGRGFELSHLLGLTRLPEEKFISLIDESISLQLLEKSMEKGKALFVHDRIRDAFYTKIPRDMLKQFHLEIARTLEESYKENLEPVIFDLAHHYTEAGDKDKALEYALPAARKAKQNYANEEAIEYYSISISILEEQIRQKTPLWIEAKEELSEVFLTIGNNDEAIQINNEILPLKTAPFEKAKVYSRIGSAYFKKGEWKNCENTLAEALYLLDEKLPLTKREVRLYLFKELFIHLLHCLIIAISGYKQPKVIKQKYKKMVEIHMSLIWNYVLSNVEKFIFSVLRVLNVAEDKIGRSKELGMALGGYGSLCMAIPLFKRAVKYHERALNLKKELNDEWGQAQSFQFMGYCYEWMGNYRKSIECFEQSREKFQNMGDIRELGMTVQGLFFDYIYLADYKRAFEYNSQYLEVGERAKDMYAISNCWVKYSHIYTETGEFNKAEESGKKGLRLSGDAKVWFISCYANTHLGYLYIQKENYDEAIKYLEAAKKLDKENNFLRNYVCLLYSALAEAYLCKFKESKLTGQDIKKIKALCNEALTQTRHWPNHYGKTLLVYAKYLALIKKNRKAEKLFLKSIEQLKSLNHTYELGRSLYEYAKFLESLGREEQSKQRYQESYNIVKEIGAKHYLELTASALNLTATSLPKSLSAQERLAIERRLSTLITVSHHLSSILNLEELLNKIVSSAIEVAGAERGFLFLYGSDKKTLEVRIAQGTEAGLEVTPSLDYKRYKLCLAIIKEVQAKAIPLLFNPQVMPSLTQDEDIKSRQIKSVIATPLKVREEVLGLLYLDNRLTENAFDEQDADLIDSLAIQAGISLQNAFLVKEIVEKERLAEELRLGRDIQMSLLPKELPQIPTLTVDGLMLPAKEIGGDYYDFIPLHSSIAPKSLSDSCHCEEPQATKQSQNQDCFVPSGLAMTPAPDSLAIVIGDVSGKGVAAGLLMAMAKTAIHTLSQENTSPKEVLLRTNSILYSHIGGQKFMTMLYFKYNPASRTLTYSSAGHEHILIYRNNPASSIQHPESGSVEAIISGGFMLGMLQDIEAYLEEHTLTLNPKDKVLLYTDGVTDAENTKGERYGLDRLKDSFKANSSKPPFELIQAIKAEVYTFIGTQPQYDDITLVGMEAK